MTLRRNECIVLAGRWLVLSIMTVCFENSAMLMRSQLSCTAIVGQFFGRTEFRQMLKDRLCSKRRAIV